MVKKNIYLIFLAIISLVVIFYNFPNYPKNIAHDETEIVRAALTLVDKPFTIFTPEADGHTTLYLYTLIGSFNLFGFNNFAMRLPVALASFFNILLFYLILNKVFDLKKYKEEIIFTISICLLSSHWFINFARFSFEIPFLLFLELISLYSLLNKKYILSAIFSGLAFNSYQPGRIFFLVPIFYLLLNKEYKRIFQFLIIFFVVITPLTIHLFLNKGDDVRVRQQLYFANNELSLDKKIDYFSQNILNNIFLFTVRGDGNGRHNYPDKPAVNPILFLFMLIGFGSAIFNFKNKFNLMFIFYFIVAMFPTMLTIPGENPNMLRTYTALPSIFYFIFLGIILFINLKKINKKILIGILLMLFFISTYKELNTYFIDQAEVFKKSFEYSKSINEFYYFR